ncbi:hypothetical protein L1987_60332 [Smallanthus sonchifolius]|uniref:Uncharacterized protein n=1 Tax=Smallanthus sonchifolius TaxID=185202 RepID=A0ACB9D854_9ASTR|nr:hypothetical protein L1987_60332 [Smallanthus sonchifolius]
MGGGSILVADSFNGSTPTPTVVVTPTHRPELVIPQLPPPPPPPPSPPAVEVILEVAEDKWFYEDGDEIPEVDEDTLYRWYHHGPWEDERGYDSDVSLDSIFSILCLCSGYLHILYVGLLYCVFLDY